MSTAQQPSLSNQKDLHHIKQKMTKTYFISHWFFLVFFFLLLKKVLANEELTVLVENITLSIGS